MYSWNGWGLKQELMDKVTAGENISIVDLRQPIDIEAFPQMIPGALRMGLEEIEDRHGEIPRDHDVVLYCS
jgi:rhodanese-related sulfurtransferase